MKIIKLSSAILFLFGLMSAVTSGQVSPDKSQPDLLPPLSEPVTCGLALRYIDDALIKASRDESTIIIIVRSRYVQKIKLARVRSHNLRNYFRFRGFNKHVVAVDLDTCDFEGIDIFVRGELLYKVPFNSEDRFEFTNC